MNLLYCPRDKPIFAFFVFSTKKRGFTLVEVLLVSGLIAVVVLALFFTFSSGIKIWESVAQVSPAEKLSLFYEKIEEDLRNTFKFSTVRFSGSQNSVSFPTLIVGSDNQGNNVLTVGKASYLFDSQTNSLKRAQADYSQIYQEKPLAYKKVLEDVESGGFEYYYYDPQRKEYAWRKKWQGRESEGRMPQAVRINIEFANNFDSGKKEVKTISIPVGRCCSEK